MKITTELRRAIESTFPERHRFPEHQEIELIERAKQDDGRIDAICGELQNAHAAVARLEKILSEMGLSFSEYSNKLNIRDIEQFRKVFPFAPNIITRSVVYKTLAPLSAQDGVAYLASIGINWGI